MQKITQLPTPPTSTDTASFNERADRFVQSLPKFVDEINTFGSEINGVMDEVSQKVDTTRAEINKVAQSIKTQGLKDWDNLKNEIQNHLDTQKADIQNILQSTVTQTKKEIIKITTDNEAALSQKLREVTTDNVLRYIDSSKAVTVVNGIIDISKGDYFVLDMRTPISLSIINEPSKERSPFYAFILEVINADRYSLTWLPNTIWEKNVAPTFTSSTRSIFSFIVGDGDIVGVRVAQDLNAKGSRRRNESV